MRFIRKAKLKRRGQRLFARRKLSSKHLKSFHNPRQFGAQPRSLNCVIVRNGIRQKAFKFLDMVVKSISLFEVHGILS